jgi:hypothetical protein
LRKRLFELHGERVIERAVEDRVARRVDEVGEQYRVPLRQGLRAPTRKEEEQRGGGGERDRGGDRGLLVSPDSFDDVLRARSRVRGRIGLRAFVRRSGRARLKLEALEPLRVGGDIGRQELQGHFAPELARVAREVDLAHPARAYRPEDFVTSSEFCSGRD